MDFDELATYLRLTPEFGGTRFGPFESLEVRLGSDPDRCHIVLQAELGVQPEHVKLFRQSANNLILAPSARTAATFLYRGNAGRPIQLSTPTAIQHGDAFSVVTPEGPRFIVELDELPEEIKEERARSGGSKGKRSRLSKDAMGTEVKRQAFTQLLVLGPAQMAQRAYTYVKSGAIFMPRNIIMGLVLMSGWLVGGASMCNNRSLKSDLRVTNVRVENCKQELVFAENLSGDSTEYTFEQLASRILGSLVLGEALSEDDTLRNEIKNKSKLIFSDTRRYNWLVRSQGSKAAQFAEWRERVWGEDAIDEDTRLLLVWLAARPGRLHSEFEDINDTEGDDVCGRGPLKMSYRQALSLGIEPMPDAFVARDYDRVIESKEQREELLMNTIQAAGGPGFPDDQFETEIDPIRQGRSACIYIEGTDDRTRMSSLVTMLARNLDDDQSDLPPVGSPTSSVARLAKYWAADLMRVDYRDQDPGLSFMDTQVGTVLDGLDQRGKWVLSRTAETVARSIVVPCLAVLKGDPEEAAATLGEALPSPVNCLVLDWKLRNPG